MKYFQATDLVQADGHLQPNLRKRIVDTLKGLPGKQVTITIEPPKQYSTNPQRQYYFGVIVTGFQDYFAKHGKWYDKDTLHEMMMTEIGELYVENPNPFTETIEKKRRSYNSLSVAEANEYHLKCHAYAAERNIYLDESTRPS